MSKMSQFKAALEKAFFSPTQEAARTAPFERAPLSQWATFLQPGRTVQREGIEFPLKKTETNPALSKLIESLGPEETLTRDRLTELLRKVSPPIEYGEVPPSHADPRYSHQTLETRYAENITTIPGLNYEKQYHYHPDTLSWSRTTSHNTPSGGVRLIEEIQSDLHQDARERGYRTPEEEILLEPFRNRSLGLPPEIRELKKKVPDAPYKDPKEYAQLEISKQLAEAADAGEDYVALVKGSDQIERYGGGTSEFQKGMEYFYDKIYPSVMKKLAKRYGAEIEDVEIPIDIERRVPVSVLEDADVEDVEQYVYRTMAFMDSDDPEDWSNGLDSLWELGENMEGLLPDTAYVRGRVSRLQEYLQEASESLNILADQGERPETQDANSPFSQAFGNAVTILDEMEEMLPAATGRNFQVPTMVEQNARSWKDITQIVREEIYGGEPEDLQLSFDIMDGLVKDLKKEFERVGDTSSFKKAEVLGPTLKGLRRFLPKTEEAIDDFYDTILGNSQSKFRQVFYSTLEEIQKLGDELSSRYGEVPKKRFPAIKLTPEVRERIQKAGVPLFTGAGAAVLTDEEEPEGFQAGGRVETGLQRLRRELEAPFEAAGAIGLYRPQAALERLIRGSEQTPEQSEARDKRLASLMGSGLASQLMSYNPETGEADLPIRGYLRAMIGKEGRIPGLIHEIAALPELADLWGGDVPEWARESGAHQRDLREAIRRQMDIEEPRGFVEHMADSLGVMGGQIPMAGISSLKRAKDLPLGERLKDLGQRLATSPIEWLSPVIDPKLINYTVGGLFGGAIGALTDEDVQELTGYKSVEDLVEAAESGDPEAKRILMDMVRELSENEPIDNFQKGGKVVGIRKVLFRSLPPEEKERIRRLMDWAIEDTEDAAERDIAERVQQKLDRGEEIDDPEQVVLKDWIETQLEDISSWPEDAEEGEEDFWRSLLHRLTGTSETLHDQALRVFPRVIEDEINDLDDFAKGGKVKEGIGLTRRRFLQGLGATAAGATGAGKMLMQKDVLEDIAGPPTPKAALKGLMETPHTVIKPGAWLPEIKDLILSQITTRQKSIELPEVREYGSQRSPDEKMYDALNWLKEQIEDDEVLTDIEDFDLLEGIASGSKDFRSLIKTGAREVDPEEFFETLREQAWDRPSAVAAYARRIGYEGEIHEVDMRELEEEDMEFLSKLFGGEDKIPESVLKDDWDT